MLVWLGIILFSAMVFFQVVNLPVEFNASARAKAQLVSLGIINEEELHYVAKVLNAAALTYVAATLQAIYDAAVSDHRASASGGVKRNGLRDWGPEGAGVPLAVSS